MNSKYIIGIIGIIVATVVMVGACPVFAGGTGDQQTIQTVNSTSIHPLAGNSSNVTPRNVILLIGDGMSHATLTAARVYKVGPNGNLTMDTLEHSGYVSTHSLNSLVTDSAAAGTAIATGQKTNNDVIAMLPNGTELKSILDIAARDMGKSTGLVTTSEITHATPAAFGASTIDRDNWNDIATDYIYESKPNILLGGGSRYWTDDTVNGSHRTVARLMAQGLNESEAMADDGLLDDAQRQGYQVIQTAQELMNLNMTSLFRNGTKILGLFAPSHMAYEYDRAGKSPNEPHLVNMTRAAIEYLSQDLNGFFLMVEGARIDHSNHANDVVRTIHDTIAFDEAVRVALDFQKKNPNTLVIVTSDHDCGGMAVEWPYGEFPPAGAIPIKDMDNLPNPHGGVWTSNHHTAVDVPIMATGPGAERVSGRMDNTNIFEIMHISLRGPPTAAASLTRGNYYNNVTVNLTSTGWFSPVKIFYTTDGSTPTNTSTQYTAPLFFNTTTTLRFIAQDNKGTYSPVYNETYQITVPPTATASPRGGNYYNNVTVNLTSTGGFSPVKIFYTTNGTTPTNASAIYTAPLNFVKTTILRFFAQDGRGTNSSVYSETYNVYRQVAYTYSVSVPVMRWVKRWYRSWYKSRGKWKFRWRSRWVRVPGTTTEHRTGHKWELT
jgi:alkaline phosphatase